MTRTAKAMILSALALVLLSGVGACLALIFYPPWMNEQFEIKIQNYTNALPVRQLLVGGTIHGEQILRPPFDMDAGDPRKDFSRLATTYYNRNGPVGRALELLNWFPGPRNTYWADARMPASLVGQCASPGCLPFSPLVGVWSEPPIGKVFLAEGGIASYARPYQWVDFYERNAAIIELSRPAGGRGPPVTFFKDAKARGANVRVLEGPERKTLVRNGPKGFYKILVLDVLRGATSILDKNLVSEELLTRDAMMEYFEALTEDGIVLIHTSNRRYNLHIVVGDVAANLGLLSAHADDLVRLKPGQTEQGRFVCEWVVVARSAATLAAVKAKVDIPPPQMRIVWTPLVASGRIVWEDAGKRSFTDVLR